MDTELTFFFQCNSHINCKVKQSHNVNEYIFNVVSMKKKGRCADVTYHWDFHIEIYTYSLKSVMIDRILLRKYNSFVCS